MLTVVTWLWGDKFNAGCVNIMANMVRRHYAGEHRMVCVTNKPGGIRAGIEIVHDTMDFAELKSPHGRNAPACYRRLRLFRQNAGLIFGDRMLSIDLDAVITGDVTELWDRDEDFIAWRDPLYPLQLNGSMLLLKAGTRPDVWADFDPEDSPRIAASAGYRGSDQAWLSYRLENEARWTEADGVYSFKRHIRGRELPENARVVFFHGEPKPWAPDVQQLGWVREYWI